MKKYILHVLIVLSLLVNAVLLFLFSEIYKDCNVLEHKYKTAELKLTALEHSNKIADSTFVYNLETIGLCILTVGVIFVLAYGMQVYSIAPATTYLEKYPRNQDIMEFLEAQTRGLEGSQLIKYNGVLKLQKEILEKQTEIIANQNEQTNAFNDASEALQNILTQILNGL